MERHSCIWLGSDKDRLVLDELEISTRKKHI